MHPQLRASSLLLLISVLLVLITLITYVSSTSADILTVADVASASPTDAATAPTPIVKEEVVKIRGTVKGAAAKAAITPEALAAGIRDNTISDSDLLPNRPAPKNYVATGAPEFALLLSSGLGRGCNLKKYPNLKQFLQFEAKYYPDLLIDYAVATDPKLKFYATKAQRDNGLIHGEFMSEDDILELLMAGPDVTKEPIESIELMDDDPSVERLIEMLSQHSVFRAFTADDNHSSQRIFKEGFVPIEN